MASAAKYCLFYKFRMLSFYHFSSTKKDILRCQSTTMSNIHVEDIHNMRDIAFNYPSYPNSNSSFSQKLVCTFGAYCNIVRKAMYCIIIIWFHEIVLIDVAYHRLYRFTLHFYNSDVILSCATQAPASISMCLSHMSVGIKD